jgi:hypothetical protein
MQRQGSNRSMKPTAPYRLHASNLVTDSARDLSPYRLFVSVLGFCGILFCAGCAATASHQVAFDESAFKGSDGSDSASVTGRAYAVYSGNKHPANEKAVELLPVNAYTTEIVQGSLLTGHAMQSDPRLAKYKRSAASDSNGKFAIRRVPAGEYYVVSVAEWKHHYEMENADDTGLDKVTAEYKKPIFAKISVRVGETVRVSQWNQECPDIGLPFAHG